MIEVRIDDLAFVPAEAILRAVAADGSALTPSGRRLEIQAGGAVDERLRSLGELPVGAAAITDAGELDASYIIHAVIRSRDEAVSATTVQKALQNGLRRVAEWGIETLALPPLGVGAGNFEAERSAGIMVPLLRSAMETEGHPVDVTVVVENDYQLDVFTRTLSHDAGVG